MLLPQDDELPQDEELLPQDEELLPHEDGPPPQDDALPHDDGLLPQDEEPEPHEEWCEEWCGWCPWWDPWKEPPPCVSATYQDVPRTAPVSPPVPGVPPTRGASDGQPRPLRKALPAPAGPACRPGSVQARRRALRTSRTVQTTASTAAVPTSTSVTTMTSPPSAGRPHRLLRGCPPR
ncbi:hypothetical protein [Streptomyces longwoodensis]|uniref:hypothetical protein n=1 Tax=Streptomyces longwoodensis TaxID=68231 RepID=UPI0038518288